MCNFQTGILFMSLWQVPFNWVLKLPFKMSFMSHNFNSIISPCPKSARKIPIEYFSILTTVFFFKLFRLGNWWAWVVFLNDYISEPIFQLILIWLQFPWINCHCVMSLPMIRIFLYIWEWVIVLFFLALNVIYAPLQNSLARLFLLVEIIPVIFFH